MYWKAVAATAELIGVLTVVLSVMCLAFEVRSGDRTLKTTSRDTSFQSLVNFNFAVKSDPELG